MNWNELAERVRGFRNANLLCKIIELLSLLCAELIMIENPSSSSLLSSTKYVSDDDDDDDKNTNEPTLIPSQSTTNSFGNNIYVACK
jgi:hypothetical protein